MGGGGKSANLNFERKCLIYIKGEIPTLMLLLSE